MPSRGQGDSSALQGREAFALARIGTEGDSMENEKLRALPRDTPDYHARQAAHLRALAENATAVRLKARLSKEAEHHESLAAMADEERIASPVGS